MITTSCHARLWASSSLTGRTTLVVEQIKSSSGNAATFTQTIRRRSWPLLTPGHLSYIWTCGRFRQNRPLPFLRLPPQ